MDEQTTEVKPVAKGSRKKKSEVQKFFDLFIKEDFNSVKQSIIADVLVPSICNLVIDIITNWAQMTFQGSRSDADRRSSIPSERVSYRDRYISRNRRDPEPVQTNKRYSYDEIVFDTRRDAESVLENMRNALREYERVSVGDMCDLAGVSCSQTDYDYGWTNLRNALVQQTRYGYLIRLPKAIPIV